MTILQIVALVAIVVCMLLGAYGFWRESQEKKSRRERTSHSVDHVVIIQCAVRLNDGRLDWRWDDRIVQIGKKSRFSEEDAQRITWKINHSIRLFLKTEQLCAEIRPARNIRSSDELWQRVWVWQDTTIGVEEVLFLDRLFQSERDWKPMPDYWDPLFY